ncbi:MAG TPA: tetratricopeptide repeat protein [Chitinophagaceae bacterium]|nr:tetratricopeptide repeat protein [Chitinophagaceae bacterium]
MKMLLFIWLCFITGLAYSQQGDAHVQKGNEAYRNGDYKAAEEEYKKALAVEPGNQAALFNLGNVLLRQKNAAGAAKQYDDVINSATDTSLRAQALYNKALAFIKQQNLDEAINAFKQALSLSPDDNDTRENLQKALNEKRQKQQQQQQNQQQQKKDEPKPQQNQKPLNKQLMEQKFDELRNQEKQLQKQLQKKPLEGQPEKDW